MLSLVPNDTQRYSLSETIHAEVSRYLYEAFTAHDGLLSNVDRWTQRRVTVENLTKIELAHASEDPVEYCYQNLIREIDAEAQTGIFLVGKDAADASLSPLANEPGVSGELKDQVAYIAPALFADALAHSNDQLDLVWVTIRARFERARVDAEVSRIAMGILMQDADVAQDMADALRSLMYPFHEYVTRHQCQLPPLFDERQARELTIMVSQLEKRAGDYADRVREITSRADTS
jgi:hypothetical protein